MRAWPLLLALLLLAGPVQGDANARDENLEADAEIQDLAVARSPTTGGSGVFAAATLDPGDEQTGKIVAPDENVWYLWDHAGDQVWADDADRPDCVSKVEDSCISHARAVAISDNGRRMVVASDLRAGQLPGSDESEGHLVFVEASRGIVARHELDHPVTDVGLSADGGVVAVLGRVPATTGAGTAHVWSFNWPSGATVTPVLNDTLPGAATSMRISPDGREVGIAGAQYWHYKRGSDAEATTRAETEPARAVALDDGPWSVVGFAKGTVSLFDSTLTAAGDLQTTFSRQPATADITSVAIAAEADLYMAGDADGRLHVFRLTPGGPNAAAFVRSFDMGAAVHDLHLSEDGAHVAFRAGSEVQFHRWDGQGLSLLWKDAPGTPDRLAMDGAGDLVAVAVGSEVVVYEALHRVTGSAPATPVLAPGSTTEIKVRLLNEGNRVEDVDLAVEAPSGWSTSLSTGSLRLEPGGSEDVVLEVTVPAGTSPGGRILHLNHTLASGKQGSTSVPVEVPNQERLDLIMEGSRSIAIDPGVPADFNLQVGNTGNVEATAELRVDAPSGWDVERVPETVTVAPGEQEDLVLRVTSPRDLPDGTSGTFEVHLEGYDEVMELTATAGAAFGMDLRIPTGFQASVGNETPFTITVVNTGNAPDSADLEPGPLPAGWVMLFENMQTDMRVQDLEPGEERDVEGLLRIGEDAEVGDRHVIEVQVASVADPTSGSKDTMIVTIGEAAEAPACPEGQERKDGACVMEGPGTAVVLVAAALIGAAAWLRRRR